jgi:acyl carrier protein
MEDASRGLEEFRLDLAAILDADPRRVLPDDRLVGDLDFDSLAFAELAVLMMERYGSQNFLAAISDGVDVEALTVRAVFENYAS